MSFTCSLWFGGERVAYLSSLIIGTDPAGAAEDVARTAEIHIYFAVDMVPETVTADRVYLLTPAAERVPASLTYANRVATLTPDYPLEPGTRYQGIVVGGPNGVVSILGDIMVTDYNWNFTTTEDAPLPAPRLIAPADGSRTEGATPLFQWEAVPGAERYEIQIARDSLFVQLLHVSSGIVGTSYIPSSGLLQQFEATGMVYWKVRALVGSDVGVWSDTWRFSHAQYTPPPQEPEWLEVVQSFPEPGELEVTDNSIELVFSEPLDPMTVNERTVIVEMEGIL